MKNIGIIGYGKIGSYVANRIHEEKKANLIFVYDKDERKLKEAKFPICLKEEIISKSKECDLVLEAASFEAVKEFIRILENTNFMICSVSALFYYDDMINLVEEITKKSGKNLYIPHGAIIGLDGLDLFEEIEITTVKSPKALIKYPERKTLEELNLKGKVYSGDVIGACKNFPLNVNVHSAIATIVGPEKVKSIIEAYEGGNEHTIFGKRKNEKVLIEIKSHFSDKTSPHVPESIYKSILEVLKEGGIKKC